MGFSERVLVTAVSGDMKRPNRVYMGFARVSVVA